MGLNKILKKVSCKIFFCVGSKCSYNEKGKGKFKMDINEENNILTNNNESEIIESSKNSADI